MVCPIPDEYNIISSRKWYTPKFLPEAIGQVIGAICYLNTLYFIQQAYRITNVTVHSIIKVTIGVSMPGNFHYPMVRDLQHL
jgi:hypothetical protein